MASEYKKRGGGYNTDKNQGQDDAGKNLDKWTEEEWQTKEGSGSAKKDDGTQKRYLPKKTWENMTEEEKKSTDNKKQEGSKEGKQYVGNVDAAKEKRKEVSDENGGKPQGNRKAKSNGNTKSNGSSTKTNGKSQDAQKQSPQQKKSAQPKANGNTRGTRQAAKDAKEHLHDGDELDAEVGADEIDDDAAKEAPEEEEFQDDDGVEEADDDEFEDEEQAKKDDAVAQKEDADLGDDEPDADENEQEEEAAEEDAQEQSKLDKQDEDGKVANGKSQSARGQKRQANGDGKESSPSKKQRQEPKNPKGTVGSKHDSAHNDAPAGSADRLPRKGQRVSWKALPGWVYGKVIEIVFEDKKVKGMRAKGAKNDPRIVLEADSGKICVHKPDGCHFD